MLASHTIYERNFQRLMRLLPGLHSSAGSCALPPESVELMDIRVLECHKYTTVLRLAHDTPLPANVALPVMTVRVCHDAGVAEVLSYQNVARLRAKYDYPNQNMFQVREKSRVNEFLGEWLDHCLAKERMLQFSGA